MAAQEKEAKTRKADTTLLEQKKLEENSHKHQQKPQTALKITWQKNWGKRSAIFDRMEPFEWFFKS